MRYHCKHIAFLSSKEIEKRFPNAAWTPIKDLEVAIVMDYDKSSKTYPIRFAAIGTNDDSGMMDCYRIEGLVCRTSEDIKLQIGFLVGQVILARKFSPLAVKDILYV